MRFITLIILFCMADSATAQIVNVENQRLNAAKNGWLGNVDLNLSYVKNTQEIYQMGGRFKAQYHKDKHTALWLSEINFIQAGNNDFVNNGFEHLRYNYELLDSGRLVLELFKQMQYNKVQKIRLRSLYGAGVRYILVNRDSAQVNIGVLPMIEFEDLTTNKSNRHLRMSSYLSFDFQLTQSFGINSITYYQPDIFNWQDFRMSNESTMRALVTKQLALKIIFRVTYDEFPPLEIPNNTIYILNGFSYNF